MMDLILNIFTRIFDFARQFWIKENTHKTVSGLLVLTFLLALAVIELNRLGLLPSPLGETLPKSHYMAINLAFSLVLILEVLGMIFILPGSLSRALGKQFEILAQAFLPEFPAVFRNSGYALATLLIRLSLTAPAYYNVLIGLSAMVLAVLLTLVYNQFYTHKNLKIKR